MFAGRGLLRPGLAAPARLAAEPPAHRPDAARLEANRSLTRRTKTIAVVSMLVMVSFSIWSFRHRWIAQAVLVVLGDRRVGGAAHPDAAG